MKNIALFPGSFDPFTNGHLDIIKRISPLFDKIIIAIGFNSQKKYMFSLEKRKGWIEDIFSKNENIIVEVYEGLTVDFCKSQKANFIVRGVRNTNDYNYEKNIAQANYHLNNEVETIFLEAKPENCFVSSSIVREILRNNGNVKNLIPKEINITLD